MSVAVAETESDLLTRDETARLMKVCGPTISTWVRAGAFPRPVRAGRVQRWRRVTILAWLREREQGAETADKRRRA